MILRQQRSGRVAALPKEALSFNNDDACIEKTVTRNLRAIIKEDDSIGRLDPSGQHDTHRGTERGFISERENLFNKLDENYAPQRPNSIMMHETAAEKSMEEIPAIANLPRILTAKSRFTNHEHEDDQFKSVSANGWSNEADTVEARTTNLGGAEADMGEAEADPDLPKACMLPQINVRGTFINYEMEELPGFKDSDDL